jgi:hypothetical protein
MGKPPGKMIETLVLPHHGRRWIVTNTRQVVLVTHDHDLAQRTAQALRQLPDPQLYRMRV